MKNTKNIKDRGKMSVKTEDNLLAPAAMHAIHIIEYISSCEHMVGVTDICKHLDINKNMAFRVLKTLEREDWLYFDESTGKYQLTLKPMNMVSSAVQRVNLNTVALPHVYSLWQEIGESTYLGILNEDKVFYLQHLDSVNNIIVSGKIGGLYPAVISAPGRALLAYCSNEYLEKYIFRDEMDKNEQKRIISILDTVRKNGYATDNEEYGPGILCYAVPIFDYTGKSVAAVGCSGAAALYESIDQFVSLYQNSIDSTAKKISSILGYVETQT